MQENTQAPEPIVKHHPDKIDIHSIFPTIQGEGPFAGTPATFVRLAGCNLQCPFCDTEYTKGRYKTPVSGILSKVIKYGHKLVVITGGEPFRQDISLLVTELHRHDFTPQIETNGTIKPKDFPYGIAVIVCSPKGTSIHPLLADQIHAYKYVLQHGHVAEDGLPSSVLNNGKLVARPKNDHQQIFVQPMDEQDEEKNKLHMQAAVQSAIKHNYRLCIQLHKIIGVE